MAYTQDSKPAGLTALTALATDDTIIVGDTSDAAEVVKKITRANLVTDLSGDFATAAQGATADTASQPGHTHTASEVTDFDTEVANNSAVAANTAKVTNATHTGEVTGSTSLTVDKTAITNKTLVTAASGDHVLIADASDTDNLKKVNVSDFLGGSGDLLSTNNLSDLADAATARTNLGVDAAGTDNSTDVTLAGTGTYITIAGQVITVDPITESDISDLGAYITGITGEPLSDLSDVTITTIASGEVLKWNGSAWINQTLTEAGIQAILSEGAFVDGDKTKLDGIEALADVTDTTNVTAAGALMDSECTSLADVKALNQSVVSGAAPTFATTNMTDATNKRFMSDAQETVLNNTSGTNTGDEAAASTTAAGIVELATTAEVTTGTDTARAITPATLAAQKSGVDSKLVSGTAGTAGNIATWNADGDLVDGGVAPATLSSTINFIIDGGGSAITTGIKGDVQIDFDCTIDSVTLLADQSGSIVVDIWNDTYANYPATDADSITASAVPTISTATKSTDATLTGWTTTISAGDILRFNVDSITTCQRVTLALKVTRT